MQGIWISLSDYTVKAKPVKGFFRFTPEPVKYSTQSEYNTIGPGDGK